MQTIQEVPIPSSGKTAFRYGLLFGLILAVVEAAIQVINVVISGVNISNLGSTYTGGSTQLGVSLVLSGVGFLVSLAGYFVVGIVAANKTGKVSTGTLAGLWTGLFYSMISCALSMVLLFAVLLPRLYAMQSAAGTTTSNYDTIRTVAITAAIAGAAFGIAIAIGIGSGVGALGGLVGKSSSKVAPRESAYPHYPPYSGQPQPYTIQGQPLPGQPYPGQPYPGQPYPGQPKPNQYPSQPYADQPPYPYSPDGGKYPPNAPSVPPTQVAPPDQPYNPYNPY